MNKETSDKQQVASTKSNVPANLTSLFLEDAGAGLENLNKDDLALPFLKLLQGTSYETKKKHANYVEGAEAGMFYNTVSKKLYPAGNGEVGVDVIPCFYKLKFPEWAPFEKSEGRPIHPDRGVEILSQTKKNDRNQDVLPNGNIIIKTANHFVIITGDRPTKALIAMKSTQLKVSRQWNSNIQNEFEIDPKTKKALPAPIYSRIYRLKSVEQIGSFTWHGYSVNLVKKVEDMSLYQMAKEFRNHLKNSEVKAQQTKEESSNF